MNVATQWQSRAAIEAVDQAAKKARRNAARRAGYARRGTVTTPRRPWALTFVEVVEGRQHSWHLLTDAIEAGTVLWRTFATLDEAVAWYVDVESRGLWQY